MVCVDTLWLSVTLWWSACWCCCCVWLWVPACLSTTVVCVVCVGDICGDCGGGTCVACVSVATGGAKVSGAIRCMVANACGTAHDHGQHNKRPLSLLVAAVVMGALVAAVVGALVAAEVGALVAAEVGALVVGALVVAGTCVLAAGVAVATVAAVSVVAAVAAVGVAAGPMHGVAKPQLWSASMRGPC